MLISAYWSSRHESQADAARQVAEFLTICRSVSPVLNAWFIKKNSPAESLESEIALDSSDIQSRFYHLMTDRNPREIPEAGFHLVLWNGDQECSAEARFGLGAFGDHAKNHAIFRVRNKGCFDAPQSRAILEALISVFVPIHAVVTTHDILEEKETLRPYDYGWLTYEKSRGLEEFPEYEAKIFGA